MMYSPIPRLVPGSDHQQLITRVLRLDIDASTQRLDLITTSQLRVSLIDTGSRPVATRAEGDTTVHVVWCEDDTSSAVTIEGEHMAIAPGETVSIPSGDAWLPSPHQLLVTIARRRPELALPLPPDHGQESFEGFNRRTTYPTPQGLTLQRWKLTEPLVIPPQQSDLIVVGLFSSIALHTGTRIDLLHQGTCRVMRAGHDSVRLVPNGLAYVLTLS